MLGVEEHAVPVLRSGEGAASLAFYRRLGFEVEWEHRFEPGLPLFASIRRGGWHVFLSEHTGDAPRSGLTYFVAEDVDALYAEWLSAGVETGRPQDQPWGMRELQLSDPDGNTLRFGSPTS